MIHHKKLPDGVFDTHIHIVTGDYDSVSRYMLKHCDHELDKHVCGRYVYFSPRTPKGYTEHYIILVTDRMAKCERRATLVHEVVHCALNIFEMKGIKYSSKHSESLAYFIEWVYSEAEECL